MQLLLCFCCVTSVSVDIGFYIFANSTLSYKFGVSKTSVQTENTTLVCSSINIYGNTNTFNIAVLFLEQRRPTYWDTVKQSTRECIIASLILLSVKYHMHTLQRHAALLATYTTYKCTVCEAASGGLVSFKYEVQQRVLHSQTSAVLSRRRRIKQTKNPTKSTFSIHS